MISVQCLCLHMNMKAMGTPLQPHPKTWWVCSACVCVCVRVNEHTVINTICNPPHPNPTWSACSACVCIWTCSLWELHPNPTPRHDECAVDVCVRVNEHTVINIICNPPHPNPTWSACSACVCIWTWRLWALHPNPTPRHDECAVHVCVCGSMNIQ